MATRQGGFFPHGPKDTFYPSMLSVTDAMPVMYEGYGEDLLHIRKCVAQPETLDFTSREALSQRIEAITAPYQQHFTSWFRDNNIDWVLAVNMTLSDAVPVTTALHRAASQNWGSGRPGGVLFWDHDLLSRYAVHEDNKRVYPVKPNEFTLVPQAVPWHVWAVVSDVLVPETREYPTELKPLVVPNILPVLPKGDMAIREPGIVSSFLLRHGILDGVVAGRPVLLCPNRIFPVKGIEISIRLLAAIKAVSSKRHLPTPSLLVFGDLEEDPGYAAELQKLVSEESLSEDVRFLGGVPLCSGVWGSKVLLDEKDLLRLSAATHGGVLYTPNVTDIESVGLGPALAAIAGLPCAVSKFNALAQVYGDGLHCVHLDTQSHGGFEEAAEAFVDLTVAFKEGSVKAKGQQRVWEDVAQQNRSLMLDKFPLRLWKDLLLHLATQGGVSAEVVQEARIALGATWINAIQGFK